MLRDTITATRQALQSGIDYAEELLAKKDWELGREHKSNRDTAEMMGKEIAAMRMSLIRLKKPDGCSYGESSPMAPNGVRRQVDLSLHNV